MRFRNRIATLVVGLVLATAPVHALRSAAPAPGEVAHNASDSASGSWLSGSLQGFWSWLESLFDEDHGGIAP
ncbi:MAG: hypothetical protein AB7G12_03860 [Thermoanaerobaculia bacterium]